MINKINKNYRLCKINYYKNETKLIENSSFLFNR